MAVSMLASIVRQLCGQRASLKDGIVKRNRCSSVLATIRLSMESATLAGKYHEQPVPLRGGAKLRAHRRAPLRRLSSRSTHSPQGQGQHCGFTCAPMPGQYLSRRRGCINNLEATCYRAGAHGTVARPLCTSSATAHGTTTRLPGPRKQAFIAITRHDNQGRGVGEPERSGTGYFLDDFVGVILER